MGSAEILITVCTTLIGITVTWIAGRHYYLKSVPIYTSVQTLIEAAKSKKPSPWKNSPEDTRTSLVWTLELIKAFEEGRIYNSEFIVCVHTLKRISDMLGEPIRAAHEAAGKAGYTLTPAWQEAYRLALNQNIKKVKNEILRLLKSEN